MRTIDVELSPRGLDRAISELRNYRDSLDVKAEILVNRLAEVGIDAIVSVLETVKEEDLIPTPRPTKEIKASGDDVQRMSIKLEGTQVLFIEFSAGVRFGQDTYPLPSGDKYGVGTYPNQTHAYDEDGWYYAHGKKSYGNPAYMPMYHGVEAMRQVVESTAISVFRTKD